MSQQMSIMMTSSNEIISAYRPLVRETHRRKLDPPTKASDAKLWCLLWCASEQTFEQTVEMSVFETLWRSLWRDVTVMLIESYAKQMKNKRTGPISKMHYFRAFFSKKTGWLDVDLWASQNEMNYSVCVNTLWLNVVVSLTGVNDITYAQNCKRLDCPISYIAPIGQALWWLIVIENT